MRNNLSLRRRLAMVFAIAGSLVLLCALAAGLAYGRLLDDRAKVIEHVDPASQKVAEILTNYVDQETGVRGFVLTGQEIFLEPYTEGRNREGGLAAEAEALLAGDAPAIAQLDVVRARAADWQRQFAEPAIAGTRGGDPTFASEESVAASRRLFDQLRQAVEPLQRLLTIERSDARNRLATTSNQLVAVMVLSLVVVAFTGYAVWRALRRWVTGPLDAVGADAREVASGDLRHEVAQVGPPEIVDLAQDIEAMRLRILEELSAVQEVRDDLARSNEELEQFAYVASHDLQEPLRKVASFCQLLEQRYKGQLDERGEQYIEFAVDGAKRMQVLINDLLAFSRVGRTTDSFEVVELSSSVDLAVRNLTIAIEESEAVIDIPDDLPTVNGDRGLLTALFQNLLGNAIKFRGDKRPMVRIEVGHGDAEWVIAVADNGIGIEPRFADRVFVIFQRLHGRDAYAGTGIGLALCKKIVEFHGGRIWLDTEHEPGTRVCFTLPEVPEETHVDEPDRELDAG